MQNTDKYVVIMAGGAGTRFWPSSQENKPKQFLDILGTGASLIQATVKRFSKLVDVKNIYVITNKMYKGLCLEQLPQLSESQIICEPSRNNTAPCVAYASFKIHALNPNAVMAVVPSDHMILDDASFLRAVDVGFAYAAQHPAIVTLGIAPTRPDTGYGYIQYNKGKDKGVCKVERFVEKPNLEIAKEYLDSGDYLWNAGIFIAATKTIENSYQTLASDIYQTLATVSYNTDEEQMQIDKIYPTTPNISFDYAIAEKADNVHIIPTSCGWTDLGTWASLYEVLPKDENQNVCNASVRYLDQASQNMIQVSPGKKVVIKGISNCIVVDNGEVLMIYPKSLEQEIKQVSQKLT